MTTLLAVVVFYVVFCLILCRQLKRLSSHYRGVE